MMFVRSIQFKLEYDEPFRSSPEERLWCAVVFSAVNDVDIALEKAARFQRDYGCVSVGYQWEIENIIREIEHDWFKEICLAVDVDQSAIVKLINKCKEKHGYDNMKFVSRVFAQDLFAEKNSEKVTMRSKREIK